MNKYQDLFAKIAFKNVFISHDHNINATNMAISFKSVGKQTSIKNRNKKYTTKINKYK